MQGRKALDRKRSLTTTDPTSDRRLRSLRSRSTIIRFSARFFSLCASARASAASCSGLAPRGAVPFIGRVAMRRPAVEKNFSGDSDRIVSTTQRDDSAQLHRLSPAQQPVEIERIAAGAPDERKGQVDLIDIAGEDIIAADIETPAIVFKTPQRREVLNPPPDLPRRAEVARGVEDAELQQGLSAHREQAGQARFEDQAAFIGHRARDMETGLAGRLNRGREPARPRPPNGRG